MSVVAERTATSLLVVIAFLLAVPAAAQAHLINTGFGPFYDGMTHLFLTPQDLLPVLALTLLAGLRGPRAGRVVLFVLPISWLAGTIAASFAEPHQAFPVATTVATIALGALVAADAPLRVASVAGCAAALGLSAGALNGIELTQLRSSWLASGGVSCALVALVALVAGQVVDVRAAWARIGLRVAGSWIAAIGLLMLGWTIRATS
jgi:hydrogenase/urease accessory protein HupE